MHAPAQPLSPVPQCSLLLLSLWLASFPAQIAGLTVRPVCSGCRCLQPLVRNRQGELYCCGCKLPVMMEAPQPSAARQQQSLPPGSEASASAGGHARLNGRPASARGTPLAASSEAGQAGAQTQAGMGHTSQTQPVPGQPGRNSVAGGTRHTQTLPPHGQAGAAPTPAAGNAGQPASPSVPSHAQAQPSPQAGSLAAARWQARCAAQSAAAAADDAFQPSSVHSRMALDHVWQSLLSKMVQVIREKHLMGCMQRQKCSEVILAKCLASCMRRTGSWQLQVLLCDCLGFGLLTMYAAHIACVCAPVLDMGCLLAAASVASVPHRPVQCRWAAQWMQHLCKRQTSLSSMPVPLGIWQR